MDTCGPIAQQCHLRCGAAATKGALGQHSSGHFSGVSAMQYLHAALQAQDLLFRKVVVSMMHAAEGLGPAAADCTLLMSLYDLACHLSCCCCCRPIPIPTLEDFVVLHEALEGQECAEQALLGPPATPDPGRR